MQNPTSSALSVSTRQEQVMKDDEMESMEKLRKEVHSYLMRLTPKEAEALRKRFRIDTGTDSEDDDLRALARELASSVKKKG